MHRHAFSLVELSIVLVILGLLTGGILAGQSLIRAAEVRSISTDLHRYYTATQTFRDKYFGLPGDITNATRFWGDQASGTGACASPATPDGTPGTCNGNGDGWIGQMNVPANPNNPELYRYWQQLAMAGLIEGSYSGISGAGSPRESLIGENVPRARIDNAGYTMGMIQGSSWIVDASNYVSVGRAVATFPSWGNFLKPEETWNLDVKMDDGRPGTGKLISSETACVTSPTASLAEYQLTNSAVACAILYNMTF